MLSRIYKIVTGDAHLPDGFDTATKSASDFQAAFERLKIRCLGWGGAKDPTMARAMLVQDTSANSVVMIEYSDGHAEFIARILAGYDATLHIITSAEQARDRDFDDLEVLGQHLESIRPKVTGFYQLKRQAPPPPPKPEPPKAAASTPVRAAPPPSAAPGVSARPTASPVKAAASSVPSSPPRASVPAARAPIDGPRGLRNFSANCFLNTMTQILLHGFPELLHCVPDFLNVANAAANAPETRDLVHAALFAATRVATDGTDFVVGHHDPADLLDKIMTIAAKTPEGRAALEVASVKGWTINKCMCNDETSREAINSYFQVYAANAKLRSVSVTDALEGIFETQVVKGFRHDSKPSCTSTQLIKTTEILQQPDVVIVHIDRDPNTVVVADEIVNVPLFKDYVPKGATPKLYTFVGAALHGGSRDGGHYTAVVRDAYAKYWSCDDEVIRPLATPLKLDSAMLLVYRSASTLPQPPPTKAAAATVRVPLSRSSAQPITLMSAGAKAPNLCEVRAALERSVVVPTRVATYDRQSLAMPPSDEFNAIKELVLREGAINERNAELQSQLTKIDEAIKTLETFLNSTISATSIVTDDCVRAREARIEQLVTCVQRRQAELHRLM